MNKPVRPYNVSCRQGSVMFANTTLSSSPDESGCCYWSSFDLTSFAKGDRLKAYVGLLNGKGPRSGDHSIIKIFRDEVGTERMCNNEIQKSKMAQSFVEPFKDLISTEFPIRFVPLLKACMDDVSLVKNVLSSGRKLCREEWVLIEEKVGKHYQCFVNQRGQANPTTATRILEAFVHFTYHYSGGKLVVSGLEGSSEGRKSCLKTPTIHSQTRKFGASDLGSRGIHTVLSNHVCNNLCRGLSTPNIPNRPEPTAPFDPDFADFNASLSPRYEQFSPFAFGQYFNFPSPPLLGIYPDLHPPCAMNETPRSYRHAYKLPISA